MIYTHKPNTHTNMNAVTLYKNFDANNLVFGPTLKNKAGGNQVYVTYENNTKIYLQTPVMSAPFGLSEYAVEGSNMVKYSIDISFKGYEEDVKIRTFMDAIRSIDEHMVRMGVERSKEWFGKPMSDAVVRELYRPLCKESKDPEKYAPTMKMKLRTSMQNPNEFLCNAYHQQEAFDMCELKPGSKVRCILEFAPVWFVNKQFGVSPCVAQLDLMAHPNNALKGFSFEEDNEDEYM